MKNNKTQNQNQVIPCFLIHVEVILTLESLRIIIQGLFNQDNSYLRAKELKALNEKFLKSQQCLNAIKLSFTGLSTRRCNNIHF